jgi:hypothetical protein
MYQLSDFEWNKSRFLDMQTRSFRYKGVYYKGVLPCAEDHMRNSHLQYFLDDCADKNFIPKMYKTNMRVDPFVAVYRQNTEYFHIRPEYWHPESIKDAALLYLEFNLFLLEKGFCLHDAHSGNFVLEKGGRAKWCDIGSIRRLTPANQASGIDECIRFLIYPLLLRRKSPCFSEWARLSFAHGLPHDLAGELRLFNPLPQITGTRKRVLELLKEFVEAVCFDYPQTTWSNYFSLEDWGESAAGARTKIFRSLVKW